MEYMENNCKFGIDDLISFTKKEQNKVMNSAYQLIKHPTKLNGVPITLFQYSWKQAKWSKKITLEQIAYFVWGDTMFKGRHHPLREFLGNLKYNMLVRAANEYRDDRLDKMVYKVDAKLSYRKCRITGPISKKLIH